MTVQKSIDNRNERAMRNYKRRLRRRRELRRRMILAFMTLFLVMMGTVSYHAIELSASTGQEQLSFKYYTSITVAYGETLWDIADEYIDYNKYKNKNEYIAEVQSINHLKDTDAIRSGQSLIIPYYSSEYIR